jgi:hypothetical protein
MVVAGAVVTSPTSHKTDSCHANCVEEQTIWSSSATKGFIQIIWENKRMLMQLHLMEWTRTGTLSRVRLITLPES